MVSIDGVGVGSAMVAVGTDVAVFVGTSVGEGAGDVFDGDGALVVMAGTEVQAEARIRMTREIANSLFIVKILLRLLLLVILVLKQNRLSLI